MYYLIFSYVLFVLIQWSSGNVHPLVVGGEELRPHVHKHLVHLKIHLNDMKKYRCSGSILSKRWIISAAHCVQNCHKVEVKKLDYVENIANVYEYTVFPKYNDEYRRVVRMAQNDLALLKTAGNILFNDNTQPIRLSETRPAVGQGVIIAGYGKNEYGKFIPREGSMSITKCLNPGAKVLCTKSTVAARPGDSGGALVSKGRLVGVITGGKNCSDGPCVSYYVDVSQHLNWIKNVTGITIN